MSKSILLSIQPKWTAKILNGEKTIEVRKRFPEEYKGWVYIYCTKPKQKHYHLQKVVDTDNDWKEEYELDYYISDDYSGCLETKVVARFYCDKVEEIDCTGFYEDLSFGKGEEILSYDTKTLNNEELLLDSCLTEEELFHYLGNENGYAIHISKLEIFDKPKELDEFKQEWYDCGNNFHSKPLTKAPQSYMFIEVEND